MLIQIPSVDKSAGSGHGMSYWLPFLGCPRKAYLDRQKGEPDQPEEERGTDRYGRPKLVYSKVGTLFHKLLEHYHGGSLVNETELEYEEGSINLEWLEALRLFSQYRLRFRPDYFGQVVSVERVFEVDDIELFGVPKFTGRIDMEVRLDKQEQVDYWIARGAGDLAIGDLLLLDTKTHKQKPPNLVDTYNESLQFHSYMMANPAKGMIMNGVIGHKELTDESFPQLFVPLPSESQRQAVKETLARCLANRNQYGETFSNSLRCFDYFSTCKYLNNACDRTSNFALTVLPS